MARCHCKHMLSDSVPESMTDDFTVNEIELL